MKRILLATLLSVLTLHQTVLVASGVATTAIVAPAAQTIVLEPYHNANSANHLPGAQWVWKSGGQSWADGDTATFESVFYADCSSAPVILKITADNEFSASLNGGAAVSGNNWRHIFTFTMSGLVCGANKLQIKVVNRDTNSPAALIFLIQQDQSQCYQCATPLSFYNRNTCQCECTKGCSCAPANPLFQWSGYPVCGCQCAQTLKCNEAQYFNQNTCGCKCKPKACFDGFKQDANSCGCVAICPEGRVWSQAENRCVCSNVRECAVPYFWNDDMCDCERRYPIDPLPCPPNKSWNM